MKTFVLILDSGHGYDYPAAVVRAKNARDAAKILGAEVTNYSEELFTFIKFPGIYPRTGRFDQTGALRSVPDLSQQPMPSE